jgi:hypothetical protein
MAQDDSGAAEYARRLYDDVLGWYKSAEAKAQIVLGIDGAFLAFLTGAIFATPDELNAKVQAFSSWTWSLLSLMMVCLLTSVATAIYCLWSRIYSRSELQRLLATPQRGSSDPQLYPPQHMWFFQMVAALEPDRFRHTLRQVDAAFEIEAMGSQVLILSKNVRKKHRAANAGFSLTAATLTLFFLAGISYMLQVPHITG